MEDTTKVVETVTETATTQQEVNYEALLAAKDAELAKVAEEKENYRKGMLKAKGKLPEESSDNDTPENLEEIIDRKVQEKFLTTREAQIQAEKDDIQKKSLARIKELELALKNRGQITSTSAGGSNQDKPEVKTDTYLSNEQLNALKAKGWDDKKIEDFKKNAIKATQMPNPITK